MTLFCDINFVKIKSDYEYNTVFHFSAQYFSKKNFEVK